MPEFMSLYVGGEMKPRPMQEGCAIEINPSGFTMVCRFDNPTQKEIQGFKSGIQKVGLYIHEGEFPVIFFLVKFFSSNLCAVDMPYNVRIMDNNSLEAVQVVNEFLQNECNVLNYFLTDKHTIVSIGVFGLPFDLMDVFKAAIQRQRKIICSSLKYNDLVNSVYAKLSTEDMFANAQYIYETEDNPNS